MLDLTGKIGLIVGVANDKSLATYVARACHEAGATLVLTYTGEKTLKYVDPIAKELGAELLYMDVTVPGQDKAVFDYINSFYGRLDFIVHAVAFAPKADLHGRVVDSSRDGFVQAMDISVHSFARLARLAEPLMHNGGAMISLSYLGGDRVVKNYGVMGPCKAALQSMTRYMADELGRKGIRVHTVSPGPLETRASGGIKDFSDLLARDAAQSPLGRLADKADVGNLVAFLVSDLAKSMTGSNIHVDAGAHILG